VGGCGKTKTISKRTRPRQKSWQWDWICQHAFDKVKAIITKEGVLVYPDFPTTFEIYTDTSSMQLRAAITQDNRPDAFFSRKLSLT
jgi:hypothetical protein